MYKLYSIPGSCSMGIHVLLNELQQDVNIININEVDNYSEINPAMMVPVLEDGDLQLREGAAIALYLLEKHKDSNLPGGLAEKANFHQHLFFNYATMHPAYNRLFFAMKNLDGDAQKQMYQKGASAISALWTLVDKQLATRTFMMGEHPSIIDYLLCVYANWGSFFDIDITLGKNVTRMIKTTIQRPSFQKVLDIERVTFNI
ncbi:glutathione S-transferase family protein [Pleionea sp. CnH1-48]|uniref:glutathione S-transferase family protein n=1 Tax=Pleionea sp. CnH1-48 TaxID=2954494 RepID=UPI002096D15E|nr:glutathione S-transferase family protein [Pleionea sp. CnH1-48]MCO7224742.1 glutathione S-transferase family protein [Pleionea sp. CnH1-48]